MKEGHFIYKKKYRLHYRIFGEGEKTTFAFHGFGQDATVFGNLPEKLKESRIISFDLPFHGYSDFPEEYLTKSLWKEISGALLQHFKLDTVSLLAYSLGGRFAIRMIADHPDRISEATFIAPDGFHYTGIYRFATSFAGRGLFRHLLKNPEKLFRLSEILSSSGILNPSIVKFARLQLGEKEQRIRVYSSWLYLRELMTSQKELVSVLKKHQIPISIYAGSKDYVIKEEYFGYITGHYKLANLNILPNRHHEMIEQYIRS